MGITADMTALNGIYGDSFHCSFRQLRGKILHSAGKQLFSKERVLWSHRVAHYCSSQRTQGKNQP